jgi:hypothetical protein
MKPKNRESLIKEAEDMIVKKTIVFEAHKNGNRKATTCLFFYRENLIQIMELNDLYLKKNVSRYFYHSEMERLCNEGRKQLLRFDVSKINAMNYLKKKEGFPVTNNHPDKESLEMIQALRRPK